MSDEDIEAISDAENHLSEALHLLMRVETVDPEISELIGHLDTALSHLGDLIEDDDEADADGGSCGSCGANIGPSRFFPWHFAGEDCRSIRPPGDYDCDADDHRVRECAECGHLHFCETCRHYIVCPLRAQGCTCRGQ